MRAIFLLERIQKLEDIEAKSDDRLESCRFDNSMVSDGKRGRLLGSTKPKRESENYRVAAELAKA